MKPIILGTAGHIDHGKTVLIKRLTGIDTDRLKEEKIRGITIELGFASLTLPNGQRLGIVDVPGHEKFVKNMVSGATGIDMVALVIAADEGIMPQTKEHLEICELLRVKRGLVVLSKIDLVEKDWLELVVEEITEFLKGTFMEGSSIVPVSSLTGDGIPQLLSTLEVLCAETKEKGEKGTFRIPIDRVFIMKGFGTVVTGSAISGSISTGDTVMIYPKKIKAKVRGIQVHNKEVKKAVAGSRTAINLQGVEKSDIDRGDILGLPDTLEPTYRVDAFLEYLASAPRPLKNRAHVRFHTGTSEIISQVTLLDTDSLKPDETAYVNFRLDRPTVVLPGDRYVIRFFSPARTMGGGEILNSFPKRHKRFHKQTLSDLKILKSGSEKERIVLQVKDSGYSGISLNQLYMRINMEIETIKAILEELQSEGTVISYNTGQFVYGETFRKLKEAAAKAISSYHQQYPLKAGLSKVELRSKLKMKINDKVFDSFITCLTESKEIIQEKEVLRLKDHVISLTPDQKSIQDRIESTYLSSGLSVPFFKDVVSSLPKGDIAAHRILEHMVESGILIRVKEDLYFHKDIIDKLKADITAFLKEKGEINPSQFKELTHTSRKYAIPLLEYLDSIRLTIRVGDKRMLRADKNRV